MLPTSAGVEPAISWSPVGRRIQLSHRGRLLFHAIDNQLSIMCGLKSSYLSTGETSSIIFRFFLLFWLSLSEYIWKWTIIETLIYQPYPQKTSAPLCIIFILNIRMLYLLTIVVPIYVLKNCRMNSKQYRPWSDAAFCSIWSRSALFGKACWFDIMLIFPSAPKRIVKNLNPCTSFSHILLVCCSEGPQCVRLATYM